MANNLRRRVRRLEEQSSNRGLRGIRKNEGETRESAIRRYCTENNVSDEEREVTNWLVIERVIIDVPKDCKKQLDINL